MDFAAALFDRTDTVFSPAADASTPLGMALRVFGTVPASAVVGVANTVMYYPFVVKQPARVLRYAWYNGATVAGNVNMCIVDNWGTVVPGSVMGTVAQSGISVVQLSSDFATPIQLTPAAYFLGFVTDSTTATFWRFGPTTNIMRASGCQQMASNFAMANATFANPTINHVCTCAAVSQVVL